MGLTEIILIIIGAVALVISFVIPAKKQENAVTPVPKIDEKQIRDLIEKEIQGARNHINDVVDETLTYSMEKTERAMERLTNEKIMAVSEYSEQVLESINKNHQEVIFLYDMLNDKHENLVNTVNEAAKKAKEIKQTVQDAEITVKEVAESLPAEDVEEQPVCEEQETVEIPEQAEVESEFLPIAPKKVEVIQNAIQEIPEQDMTTQNVDAVVNEEAEDMKSYNNNEKILRLHKLGMSKTAIAKELGLGVGEVKLVIDLFEQA